MKTADNRCRQESKRKKLATQEPVVVTFNISNRCRCECSWNFNWIWSPNSQKLYIFPFPYNPPRPSSPPSILRSLVHTRIASSIFAASLPPMCGCFLDAFAFGFHFILLFVFCGIFFNTRKTSYVHANYWSITKRTIHPAVEQPIHYHEYIWYVTNNDVNFHLDFFFHSHFGCVVAIYKCVYSFLLFVFFSLLFCLCSFLFRWLFLQYRVHTAIIYRYSPPFRAVLCLDMLIQCLQNQAKAESSFLYVWLSCCCWCCCIVRLCAYISWVKMQLKSLL